MLLRAIFILVIVSMTSPRVYAECSYNGQVYSEGTVIGPYVCKDGKWIRR